MSFLGFRERSELRRTVARGIRTGQLPQSASLVLYNPDAFAELEHQVYGQAQADMAAIFSPGTTPATGAPAHPILNWIVTHAPQILAFVLMILPLFGVAVPPIAIPGLPPKPPVVTAPSGNPANPTAPIPHSSAANPTQPDHGHDPCCNGSAAMPTDFAIPALVTAFAPVLEQVAAQVAAIFLPQLEAKVQQWIDAHLKAAP